MDKNWIDSLGPDFTEPADVTPVALFDMVYRFLATLPLHFVTHERVRRVRVQTLEDLDEFFGPDDDIHGYIADSITAMVNHASIDLPTGYWIGRQNDGVWGVWPDWGDVMAQAEYNNIIRQRSTTTM